MEEKLQELDRNHTWDMVTLPLDITEVCCRWIYKIKIKSDGSINRYKTYLVVRRFTKKYDIVYEVTFVPIARLTSLRSLLAVGALKH